MGGALRALLRGATRVCVVHHPPPSHTCHARQKTEYRHYFAGCNTRFVRIGTWRDWHFAQHRHSTNGTRSTDHTGGRAKQDVGPPLAARSRDPAWNGGRGAGPATKARGGPRFGGLYSVSGVHGNSRRAPRAGAPMAPRPIGQSVVVARQPWRPSLLLLLSFRRAGGARPSPPLGAAPVPARPRQLLSARAPRRRRGAWALCGVTTTQAALAPAPPVPSETQCL
jgi:hypothetical protein